MLFEKECKNCGNKMLIGTDGEKFKGMVMTRNSLLGQWIAECSKCGETVNEIK